MYLSKLSQKNGEDIGSVTYSDLASVVQRKDSMEFLHDVVPNKIKFKEYLELMQRGSDDKENKIGDELELL